MGRLEEARAHLEESLRAKRRILGEDHLDTLRAMNNLANVGMFQGRDTEASNLFREVIERRTRTLGEDHYETLGAMTNLGLLYNRMGRYDDAREQFEICLPMMRNVLTVRHEWTRYAMDGLARAYRELDRPDDAFPLERELLSIQVSAAEQGPSSARALNAAAWHLLTHAVEELRDPSRALALAQRARAAEEASGGNSLWMYLDTLALAQHMTGDTAAAIESQKHAIELRGDSADQGMRDRLARYEAALAAVQAGSADDQRQ
jgi:tetratricopeptide (TPR) repeat protein